jgi:hypothetical protein
MGLRDGEDTTADGLSGENNQELSAYLWADVESPAVRDDVIDVFCGRSVARCTSTVAATIRLVSRNTVVAAGFDSSAIVAVELFSAQSATYPLVSTGQGRSSESRLLPHLLCATCGLRDDSRPLDGLELSQLTRESLAVLGIGSHVASIVSERLDVSHAFPSVPL